MKFEYLPDSTKKLAKVLAKSSKKIAKIKTGFTGKRSKRPTEF